MSLEDKASDVLAVILKAVLVFAVLGCIALGLGARLLNGAIGQLMGADSSPAPLSK